MILSIKNYYAIINIKCRRTGDINDAEILAEIYEYSYCTVYKGVYSGFGV